ncbi:hypothetical protein A3I35_00470 [Candidatus Falkowbacteria bacterium RIFCSPLOWO2_02_FULL_45_15]|uniref:GMP synthase (glutamine-hydrolyzing) n=1 Tax=Candidatus Falkowbacteria bacterium RIFCSPLOWO2_02_FULL_45_15 TaxID=1797988 RepID=A0A1F5RYE5_9BACT|nr:MAG: hypothetical protein A3I35_00470 [Candidatus Falkowbacteria bacterium RIFCSPLOWO2_02_FULL_45_15]
MRHIAILDFGSQYTHLIARRIRELNVLAKIYPNDIAAAALPAEVSGIILSCGPQSVYDAGALTVDPAIFTLGKPILGVCYGHQLMAQLLGGQVRAGKIREYGRADLTIVQLTPLLANVNAETTVWMSHGDSVTRLPAGFAAVARTNDCPITAMADEDKKLYGLQFHPEVDHTPEGVTILSNFVFNICRAEKNWYVEDIVAALRQKILQPIGGPGDPAVLRDGAGKKVFILVSGGVDSSVAFALLTKTLGEERVKGLYIDTGFMRRGESAEIAAGFRQAGLHNFTAVDASDVFYKNLEQVYEPEAKRNIIGQTFLDVKDEQIAKLNLNSDEWLLGQGTIYPDIIESSGSQNAQKIKTHHNRVDAIKRMVEQGLVVEPLIDFYKFEVRQIGRLLNLPPNLINRHPFPGPGLAIRCLCRQHSAVADVAAIQNKADVLFAQKYPRLRQRALPLKSVGVQGDNRTYAHPLAVWGEADWEKLDALASQVTNTIKDVNRVVLLLNPPAEPSAIFKLPACDVYVSRERINLLRQIDDMVISIIRQNGIYDNIWQFPSVLIPIVDEQSREAIVLRPFNSRDVMTATFYRMDKKILSQIVQEILATGKISYVFYDVTNKPPGTTEWE